MVSNTGKNKSGKCYIPPDNDKIANAFKKTLLALEEGSEKPEESLEYCKCNR